MKKICAVVAIGIGIAAGGVGVGVAVAQSESKPPSGFDCAHRGVYTDHGWICDDDPVQETHADDWTTYAPYP